MTALLTHDDALALWLDALRWFHDRDKFVQPWDAAMEAQARTAFEERWPGAQGGGWQRVESNPPPLDKVVTGYGEDGTRWAVRRRDGWLISSYVTWTSGPVPKYWHPLPVPPTEPARPAPMTGEPSTSGIPAEAVLMPVALFPSEDEATFGGPDGEGDA